MRNHWKSVKQSNAELKLLRRRTLGNSQDVEVKIGKLTVGLFDPDNAFEMVAIHTKQEAQYYWSTPVAPLELLLGYSGVPLGPIPFLLFLALRPELATQFIDYTIEGMKHRSMSGPDYHFTVRLMYGP